MSPPFPLVWHFPGGRPRTVEVTENWGARAIARRVCGLPYSQPALMDPLPILSLPEARGNTLTEQQYLIFEVDGRRLALPIIQLERVIQAAEITLVPGAHASIAGGMNMRGTFVPVVNVSALLGRAGGPAQPDVADHFLLVQHQGQDLALWVHEVLELVTAEPMVLLQREDTPAWYGLQTPDGLILLMDLTLLFSRELALALEQLNPVSPLQPEEAATHGAEAAAGPGEDQE